MPHQPVVPGAQAHDLRVGFECAEAALRFDLAAIDDLEGSRVVAAELRALAAAAT